MRFETTQWTLVTLANSSSSDEEALRALEQLCKSYWPPLYAFARSRGLNAEDAKDLTQGFFTQILEKNVIDRARKERGKFRNFLLASMKHYMTNEWRRDNAQKRGGEHLTLSLDDQTLTGLNVADRVSLAPDHAYELQWARTTLDRALARLEAEHTEGRKHDRFLALRDYVTASPQRVPYARLSMDLGMTEEALRTSVHRLRARYGELIRREIEETLGPEDSLDEEIRYLLSVLSRQ